MYCEGNTRANPQGRKEEKKKRRKESSSAKIGKKRATKKEAKFRIFFPFKSTTHPA
jgi:hypothetical protein